MPSRMIRCSKAGQFLHSANTHERKIALSLAQTAQSIMSLLPEKPTNLEGSVELTILWELCLTAAKPIPYYHVCQ